jgi:glc operon protein GlcG
MDNVSVQAGLLAQNKAYTSARDKQPSGNLGAWAKETGKDLNYWTDPKITGFKGGVPVELKGQVIGAIGISGLSEDDDEALAEKVIQLVF